MKTYRTRGRQGNAQNVFLPVAMGDAENGRIVHAVAVVIAATADAAAAAIPAAATTVIVVPAIAVVNFFANFAVSGISM